MNLANAQTRPAGAFLSANNRPQRPRFCSDVCRNWSESGSWPKCPESGQSFGFARALRPRETFIALSGGASEQLLGIAPRQEPEV